MSASARNSNTAPPQLAFPISPARRCPDSQPLLPYFSIDSRSGCGLEDLVSFLVVIVHF